MPHINSMVTLWKIIHLREDMMGFAVGTLQKNIMWELIIMSLNIQG